MVSWPLQGNEKLNYLWNNKITYLFCTTITVVFINRMYSELVNQ